MVLTIKHKAGKFNNRWWIDILLICYYYSLKLRGIEKVRVWFYFYDKSKYKSSPKDQADWLKAFGGKTGFKTATNREQIAAYRYLDDVFEICIYNRRKGEHYQTNVRNVPMNYWSSVKVDIGYLPYFVTPWAGGTTPPQNDFEYKIDIWK